MAVNQSSFKVNQIAKDMGLKSKDLLDLLSEKGIDAKSQVSLDPMQFEILFNSLTKNNQVNGIEDYIDGITYIPSKNHIAKGNGEDKASEKKETAKKASESEKPEAKAVKSETPAPKPEEKKPEKPNAKPAEKPASKPSDKASAAKKEPAVKDAPAQTQKASKPAENTAAVPQSQKKTDEGAFIDRSRDAAKYPPRQQNTQGQSQPSYQQSQRPSAQTPQQRQSSGQGQYNQNNQTQRAGAPYQQAGYTQKSDYAGRGDFGGKGDFGGRSDFSKGDYQRGDRNGQQRAQKPQQRQDHNSQGFNDKGGNQNAPKERFQPVAIVRGQTPKGTEVKQKGGTRIVDMRGSSVDLSKYDDKLESFASDDMNEARGGSQRLRKGQPQLHQNQGFQKGKKPVKGASLIRQQPKKVLPSNATIPDEIMVSDFSSRIKVPTGEIIKKLIGMGMMVTANQTIDFDTAALVADEFGINVTKEVVVTIEEKLFDDSEDSDETLVERAPVVCVMGHVDHGKTSILDAIRHTNVTSGEAGGITQHIGAYRVKVNGKDITFLDTPGHEAFTAMRARGAMATDIAILVVAADDGIMPQTVEAINHAKAAGIDIIVAINKMDKPGANPEGIKQELTKYDLVPEEWGGDIICVPVSALTGQGIDDLLENVLLVAEVKELKANPNRRAKGIVIEAKLDKGRGPVATVLVQNGTLHSGDTVIAGTAVGRVRAMTDHNGKMLKTATPSVPVEITGLSEVPVSGDEFNAVEDERMARELADKRKNSAKEAEFKANARANLNDLFAQISEGVKDLNIVVKADVGGSVEAVKQSLVKISNDEVRVSVIHAAVGGITEGDVTFAAASNAIIVGFNVRPDKAALDLAERQGVDIRTYRIIYECIEEITAAMKGMLAPTFKENLLGHIEVRDTIHVPSVGTIAGSYVLDGKVTRASQIRIVRDGIVIFEDKIASLRRFKDDVREVAQGYECGIALEKFDDIKIGDILEAFVMEEVHA